MKKNHIEIKSAKIQKFRLRRSDSVYGILPEITFCIDRCGVAKHAQQFELFGVHTCTNDFLVDILSMFYVYYPHELAGHSANIIFLDGKAVGISPDGDDWVICTKDGYQRVSCNRLLLTLAKAE